MTVQFQSDLKILTLSVWIINSVSFWNLISNSLWWFAIGCWLVVVIIECDFSVSRRSLCFDWLSMKLCFDWSMVSILDSIGPLSRRLFDDEEDISRIDKTEGFWEDVVIFCVGGSVGGCVVRSVPWLDDEFVVLSEERDLFWLVVRTRFCLLSSLICSKIDPLLFYPRKGLNDRPRDWALKSKIKSISRTVNFWDRHRMTLTQRLPQPSA